MIVLTLSLRIVPLMALWLLAWGGFSVPNVISGFFVAAGVLIVFPPRHLFDDTFRFRPVALARLILYVAYNLVVANVVVARSILAPGPPVRSGVIEYEVRYANVWTITLVSNIIALSPGTMTVEARRDPGIIYVHFLEVADAEAVRRDVTKLERLVVAALGGPELWEAPS